MSREIIEFAEHPRGVIVPVRAHAGARRNGILGTREGMLRVAVTAAPEKGKANRAIVAVLSETLGVAKSSIELVSGDTAPQKRFLVVGAASDVLRARIAAVLDN
jgi:uncharacterized protein (TIGR00251 family)